MENTPEAVVPVFRDLCGVAVEPDGMVFDPASVAGVVIKEDADYPGVRVAFLGRPNRPSQRAVRVPVGAGVQGDGAPISSTITPTKTSPTVRMGLWLPRSCLPTVK